MRDRTIAFLAAAVLGAALVATPGTAMASGGDSIASAPLLAPSTLATGGGKTQEFWRIALFAGDRLTIQAENDDPDTFTNQGDSFELYPPSVNDYSLGNSQPLNGYDNGLLPPSTKTQFSLTAPFTGDGILDICHPYVHDPCPQSGARPASAFSFTVFIAHLTTTFVTGPRYAKRRSRARITGHVSSPAGTPTGVCSIDGHITPLVGGSCSRRVQLGRGRKQTIPVKYLANGGWQDSSGKQLVHLYKP